MLYVQIMRYYRVCCPSQDSLDMTVATNEEATEPRVFFNIICSFVFSLYR